MAKARTGKVAMPFTLTGTANSRNGRSPSWSSPRRCSRTGMPAANSAEWTGRSPAASIEVSSMLTESMPTSAAPASTRCRAAAAVTKGWAGAP